MTTISSSLKGHLLVAMPNMADPNFHQTVTLICEHDENGALGIIINRPTQVMLVEILSQLEIKSTCESLQQTPVYSGGPVQQERGFIVHDCPERWAATLILNHALGVTASQDILNDIAKGQGPEHFLTALGYAGWGPGQLEAEIAQNAWLNTPIDAQVVFDTPASQRWPKAAALIGVDLSRLSGDIGHA